MTSTAKPLLLPDFCAIGILFPLVVIGELLAFVLVLKPGSATAEPMTDLALTSLFVQWVVLSSAGLLCVARRYLNRLPPTIATLGALTVIIAVVAGLSEAAFWFIAAGHVSSFTTSVIGDSVVWLAQQEVLPLSLESARHADFLLRNVAIGAIVGAVALRYVLLQYRWKLQHEAEAQARVAALQARIRPHFLFNSMNTIASFTRTRPQLAEQVVEDLADLFRAALVDVGARSTLRSELGLTEQYLRIEGLRLGVRLNVRWRVDGLPGHFELPSLILQPLVENCVYHGIEPLPQGGTIEITGRVQNEGVFIELKNAMPPGGSAKQGHGIAQANVEARLRAFFGEQVEFQAESREGNYVVTMHLPRAEALSA